MGWAARISFHGNMKRREPTGVRVVCCANCGEYDGTLRRAFVHGGRQYYIHDFINQHRTNRACRVRYKERRDAERTIEAMRKLAGAEAGVDTPSDQQAASGDRNANETTGGGGQ